MPRPEGAVGVNVTAPARDALRDLSYRLSLETGRRVTMSEALAAVCAVAGRDMAATVAALTESDAKDRS
jgi:hypothetical protein